MMEMIQCTYEHSRTFKPAKNNEGLATGYMSDCVSVIALGEPFDGTYRKIIGMHGAGGISNCNFKALMSAGALRDSRDTRFIIIKKSGQGSLSFIMEIEFGSMVEESKLQGIHLSQFEVYLTMGGNACVLPNGKVHEYVGNAVGHQIREPKARFIMQFYKNVKWDQIGD